MKHAVLYLRSSKDQKDVSIQSQRHELTALAAQRGLTLVGEYSDAVESGKDWDRPGFQKLIKAIRNRSRGWTAVLTKDTSRIARRRNLALIFEEVECFNNDVEVIYANLPDNGDPTTMMIVRAVMQAFDEWHSLTSRDKGLAGMAENVRQGYRAAGHAPYGYRLRKVDIGLVRDGAPVTKSVLEPALESSKVQKFLDLRATNLPRMQAAHAAGLELSSSTLVGIEWNALTYAGCTTFGVFQERTSTGGYKGQRKRRPRSEWVIQSDTHPALITRQQAEAILNLLEHSDHAKAVSQGKAGVSRYLLSGLLMTPNGITWEGNKGAHYFAERPDGSKRYVPLQTVEQPILDRITSDLPSEPFAQALIRETASKGPDYSAQLKELHRRIAEIAVMIDKAASLALGMEDPGPFQRKIEALERERKELVEQQQDLREQEDLGKAVRSISVAEMRHILSDLAESMRDAKPEALKVTLRSFVKEIVLDPASLECRIEYAVSATNTGINPVSMALLPGFEPGFKP
ncbi:MAG: hypothetical protein JWR07_4031 [Nevskia sp.]|nr:hypothetical protein [Nevskia sp.]